MHAIAPRVALDPGPRHDGGDAKMATQRFVIPESPSLAETTTSSHISGVEPTALQKFGQYTLLFPIGHGGMGDVWVARQSNALGFRKLVAVKVLRTVLAADPIMRRMFLEEAQLAARIHHANVVEVTDLGEEGSTVYLVMSFVEGRSLSKLVAIENAKEPAKRLPIGVCLSIIQDALAGLHAAHELRDDDGHPLDLVHRDISPQNILVGLDGVARLADFGIAKVNGLARIQTNQGEIKGKFAYVAPEQIAGRPPTRQSDLFAMGVVLWELLAGRPLFQAESAVALLGARAHGTAIPDLRQLSPDVPPEIVDVVMRSLANEPSERFSTAREMSTALERASQGVPACSKNAVADLVQELSAEAVQQIFDRVETMGPDIGIPASRPHQDDRSREVVPPTRRRPWLAGLGTLAMIVVVVVAMRSRARTPEISPTPSGAPSTIVSESATLDPSSITSSLAPAPSSSVVSTPSAPLLKGARPPPRRSPSKGATASSTTAFHPTYDSPYR